MDVLRGRCQELPEVRSKVIRVFVSSTFFMFIGILTMVLWKKRKKNHTISMIKANGINNHSSIPSTDEKYDLKNKNLYDNDSINTLL